MKPKRVLKTADAVLKAKVGGRRAPVVVGWAITDRCNKRCTYCSLWHGRSQELTTEEVFRVIDELSGLGTVRISLTGGEPLVRDDIGSIVDYAHNKGMEIKMNSNGALVKSKISELKHLDVLNLSLEGSEEVHDAIRGNGSYREVIEAAEAARQHGIKVLFCTVLTKLNLDAIDFVLNKAKEMKTKAMFQPATPTVLGETAPNPIAPSAERYRRAINNLIDRKRRGERAVANSVATLRHLLDWPDMKPLRCTSGWISCRIEPNGDVIYCSRGKRPASVRNCIRDGFKEAFLNLASISCSDCNCAARVELNLAFGGNLPVIWNQIRS